MPKKTYIWLILSLLVTFGAFVRFTGLSRQSFWYDELVSWNAGSHRVLHLSDLVRWDNNAPGFGILMHFMEKYVGDSEAVLRFPSAAAGVASILAIFLVASRLYSARVGLISAALMAVLWTPVYYSQEARAYSLLLLFTLLTTYYWLILCEGMAKGGRPSRSVFVYYAVSAVVTAYLHHFGTYLILLQGLGTGILFSRKPGAVRSLLVLYGIIGTAYLPAGLCGLYQLRHNRAFAEFITAPVPGDVYHYLRFLFFDSPLLVDGAIVLFLFIGMERTHRALRRSPPETAVWPDPDIFLFLWLTIPFGGVYLFSRTVFPLLYNRYLIISMPAAYILVARALTLLPLRAWMQDLFSVCLIVYLTFTTFGSGAYYSKITKTQFREAFAYIVSHNRQFRDVPLLVRNAGVPEEFDYYERKYSLHSIHSREYIPRFSSLPREQLPAHIWLLRVPSDYDPRPVLNAQRYQMVDVQSFYDVSVSLFAKEHPSASANTGRSRQPSSSRSLLD